MRQKITVTQKIELELGPEELARAFCELSDDDMAQFFIECGKLGNYDNWFHGEGRKGVIFSVNDMFYFAGSHLKTCECSTPEAREVVEHLYDGMLNGTHK